MTESNPTHDRSGAVDPFRIEAVMVSAVRDALRRHMLLGESVAVAGEDGDVRILTPDQIREVLEGRR